MQIYAPLQRDFSVQRNVYSCGVDMRTICGIIMDGPLYVGDHTCAHFRDLLSEVKLRQIRVLSVIKNHQNWFLLLLLASLQHFDIYQGRYGERSRKIYVVAINSENKGWQRTLRSWTSKDFSVASWHIGQCWQRSNKADKEKNNLI